MLLIGPNGTLAVVSKLLSGVPVSEVWLTPVPETALANGPYPAASEHL